MPEAISSEQQHVLARLEDWRRRLIDLSYRNRLIRYRPTKATTLTIEAPSIHELVRDPGRTRPWRFYFPPEIADSVGDDTSQAADFVDEMVLRSAGERHRPPKDDEIVVTERNPKRISRILDNLAKRSNTEFQDKALRILYLAAGFLEWVDPARDEELVSPLVLVPVELRRQSAKHPYQLYCCAMGGSGSGPAPRASRQINIRGIARTITRVTRRPELRAQRHSGRLLF